MRNMTGSVGRCQGGTRIAQGLHTAIFGVLGRRRAGLNLQGSRISGILEGGAWPECGRGAAASGVVRQGCRQDFFRRRSVSGIFARPDRMASLDNSYAVLGIDLISRGPREGAEPPWRAAERPGEPRHQAVQWPGVRPLR